MLEITAKVDKRVKDYEMLSKGDFVVVGVSGGADSMFLLNYLIGKREELKLNLSVANVEHGIRGQESVADTEFVKKYCEEHNVDFKSISIDAVNESKSLGMGVEEYSRQKRYEFFNSFNADKIATAHNLSDNVETFLFRLCRGTSVKGLTSIPCIRGKIIRPLIDVSGDEIREYCNQNNIPYRIDSTNADNDYSRNKIRNQIIPLFEEINPSFEQAVARLIKNIDCEDNYLDATVQNFFCTAFDGERLDIRKLRYFHEAMVKRVVVILLERYNLPIDEFHINEIYKLIFKSGKYQISNEYFAVSDNSTLRIAQLKKN